MQNIHNHKRLRPEHKFSRGEVYETGAPQNVGADGASEDGGPEDGRDGIVQDQVAILDGR